MRLLTTSGEPRLQTFMDGEKMPKYAILSHCWMANDEEVVFSDLANLEKAEKKPGWQKLDYARRQARAKGYKYVWADTVCIDKSSSAELSEAINSMFKWYKESAVCYAYLADMPDPGPPEKEPQGLLKRYNDGDRRPGKSWGPALDQAFCQSKWFTRGWTLQEMLAPDSVVFFSAGWKFLGSRWALRDLVTRCTRVQFHEPQRSPLRGAGVAQRMSWAACRKTTRVEDRAYSLLGIFGVNMPIIYGEGEKAFLRLQQEIIRTDPDQSMLAWHRTTPASHQSTFRDQGLLAPNPDCFERCAGIVPLWRSQYKHCDVTSTGIRLRLPLRELERQGTAVVMLQCRDAYKPDDGSVLLYFSFKKENGDDFIVYDIKRDMEGPVTEEVWFPQQWSPRNLTLLFNRPNDRVKAPDAETDSTTLIVRSGIENPTRYKGICRAEPAEHWNGIKHSFNIPLLHGHTYYIFEGHLTFMGCNGEKRNLSLFLYHFMYGYRFELQFVQSTMPDWQQEWTRSRVVCQCEGANSPHKFKTDTATAACILANGNILEARMWIESVLDQTIVILSVTEKTTAQTGVEQEDIEQKALPDDCGTIEENEPSTEDVDLTMESAKVCRERALGALREAKHVERRLALRSSPMCTGRTHPPCVTSPGMTQPPYVISSNGRTIKDIFFCKLCLPEPIFSTEELLEMEAFETGLLEHRSLWEGGIDV